MDGDSVEICVDGCRSLPDNATVCKISALIASDGHDIILSSVNEICRVDQYRYDPETHIKEVKIIDDCSAVIICRVDTIDSVSKEICCVGYVFFPLFVSSDGIIQPKKGTQNVYLRSGNYQLPILPIFFDFSKDSLRVDEPPILTAGRYPCSTLLLRIKKQSSIPLDVSHYYYGIYDNSYCIPTPYELILYDKRENRINDKIENISLEAVNEKIDVREFISKTKQIMSEKPQKLIDLKHIVKYDEKEGFFVNISSVYGYNKKAAIKVLYTVIPFNKIYFDNPSITDYIEFNTKTDFESKIGAIKYLDQYTV